MKPLGYVYGIDIIRFLAAFSVVGFHLGYLNDVADLRSIWPVTWLGWIGVEIFFVISGFVIANSANGKRALEFLKGRFLRLYPAVWCCATFTLIVVEVISDEPFANLLPSYFRTLALIPKGPWIDDVYWTLAVEIGFYTLIFGLLCVGKFSLINRLAMALTVFSSICLCVLAALRCRLLSAFGLANLLDHSSVFLTRHGCFFALGVWLWISSTKQLKAWERVGLAVSIIACIGEILLRGLEYLPLQIGNMSWLISPVCVWTAAVGCIFAFSRPHDGVPISEGRAKRVRTLGLMTYPLYLVHHIVGLAIMRLLVSMGIDKWIVLASGIASMIALSWIVCKFWEPRIRNALLDIGIRRPILGG